MNVKQMQTLIMNTAHDDFGIFLVEADFQNGSKMLNYPKFTLSRNKLGQLASMIYSFTVSICATRSCGELVLYYTLHYEYRGGVKQDCLIIRKLCDI